MFREYTGKWSEAATRASASPTAPLPIPALVSLRGLRLCAQGFVADPLGSSLGVAITAGPALMVGD